MKVEFLDPAEVRHSGAIAGDRGHAWPSSRTRKADGPEVGGQNELPADW